MPQRTELVSFVVAELERLADAKRAAAMAAYMKTTQPSYGVGAPQVHAIAKEARHRFVPASHAEYVRRVRALWRLPHREPRYVAIEYAKQPEFLVPQSMALYERMIREGAWWDFVDGIAASLVGLTLLRHRQAVRPLLERWIEDPDFWIRRAAILAHLRHKGETDSAMLFRHCLACSGEREFFIRKAIGWALREYSKAAPGKAAAFLKANKARLAPLSLREGAKHLTRIGQMPGGVIPPGRPRA